MVLKIFYGRRKNPKYMVSYHYYVEQTRTNPDEEPASSSGEKSLKDAYNNALFIQATLQKNGWGLIPIKRLDYDDSAGNGIPEKYKR